MTSSTRRHCNCCRLAKCFRVGMNPNAILSDDERMERNQLIQSNRQKRAKARTDDERDSTKSNKQIKVTIDAFHPEIFVVFFSRCQIPSNRLSMYSSSLSTDDHDMLTNIYQAHEQTCVEFTYKEHLNMSIDETLTLNKFLNVSANIYLGLIRYLKLIPEFNQLPVDNRLSLIKSNLNQIFRIQSTFSIKTVTPDLDKDSPVCLYLFPDDLYFELRTTAIALTPFIHDPILIKLYIIILMFSTHMNIQYDRKSTEILDENSVRNTFHAQNIYVSLLWRYMLSRSNSSYRQSVQMFTSLIGRTLYSEVIQTKLNEFVHSNLLNQSQSLEPIIKAIWTSD